MSTISSFRDLLVWQKGIRLAVRCHALTKRFPREDQYVLGREIRKSSLSIPSHVAEGEARHSTQAYINHLFIANGSCAELQTQLEVAHRVSLVTEQEATAYLSDAQELGRMLGGLIRSLERTK